MFRLIPREEKFFDFFAAAAQNILRGAQALTTLMDGEGGFEVQWRQLEDLEHEGDKITHQILRKVNRTFITPIDREDIYALATALDDVMDFIEAVAARMALYKIKQPTDEAKKLTRLILRSAEEIVKAIAHLEVFDQVQEHCIEINRLENMADDVSREAIARLFDGELPPIEVIKWKEIYETLETATDRCEDVANIVETIALKNS